MSIRTLTASAAALIVGASACFSQETMTDGLVMVNVAGSMVAVPVSIAAEACGMDAAAVIAASDMMNTDAKGADMVAPEPDAAAANAADEATTEAAVGTGAASTETEAGSATEATTDMADADSAMSDDAATADASTDTAANDADAATPPEAVCEIDQATADQHGITAASATTGG